MNEIVTSLNHIVTDLNGINPYWYVVLVAPLLTVVQHLMKAEQNFEQSAFAKKHGLLLALLLAFGAGGFYSVFKTTEFTTFLRDTGLVGSPIAVIANALFQKVAQPIERYRASQDMIGTTLEPVTAEPSAAAATSEV